MSDLDLSEIKAKLKRGEYPVTGLACDAISALCDEVERLREVISSMGDIHTRLMRAEEQKLRRVTVEREAQEAKSAMLNQALEMMYVENKEYNPDGMGNPAYYLQRVMEASK